jgi:hypothetical protein
VHTETGARSLGRVGGSDALLGGANRRAAELDLLEAIDNLVEAEDKVGTVRDEETVRDLEA